MCVIVGYDGGMATNIRIEGVSEELLREARLQAVASGQTLKAWIVGLIETGARGVTPVTPAERSRQALPASRSAAPTKRKAAGSRREVVKAEPSSPMVKCSHGLLFHPGCPD